jgi:FMN phosphatase YigB (HAD superfamily)
VFVGDSLARDMIGARGVGMPHVWLAPGSARDSHPCCPDDAVIHRLTELEELLR